MQAPGIAYPTMDFATVILQWKERPLGQWLNAGNRVLPQAASAVLVVAIAFQLAKLTWLAVPGPTADPELPTLPPPSATAPGGQAQSLDLTDLIDAHLFGVVDVAPPPVIQTPVDAPDTTLNLQLTAVISSDDPQRGWAIIAAGRGQSDTYFVGDTLENAGGAMLHAVYADRVLLNRSGRLETLRLPKELRGATVAARSMPQLPVAAQPDTSLRDVISENASRLTEVIRVAPYIDQGQMLGFRVNPSQDRATFEALGLQPNDIVTDINGMPLTDPSSGLQVFQSLGEATMANVTVIRNGNPEVLVIDTSQLERLNEGRQ